MKKFLVLLAFVVIVGYIVVDRQRLFVRDPFAAVYKSQAPQNSPAPAQAQTPQKPGAPENPPASDPGKSAGYENVQSEVKQTGIQVFINYSNDVLLVKEDQPAFRILLQNWNRAPGTPTELKCVRWMACLIVADHAPTLPLPWTGPGKYDPTVTMSNNEVSFIGSDGATIRVALR